MYVSLKGKNTSQTWIDAIYSLITYNLPIANICE